MPLPANLSALMVLRPILLLMPALVWAADLTFFTRDAALTVGQPKLNGSAVMVGTASLPLDRLVGVSGPASPPRWLDQGVLLVTGDQYRGTILGAQKGNFQLVSDLLGPMDIPTTELALVVLLPQRVGSFVPPGFTGALFVNGDRLPGQIAYLDERNVGIDNGRKVLAIPRERVSTIVLRPCAVGTQPHQVLRLVNGDRVTGQIKAWGPAGLELLSARGLVRCGAGEISAVWSEGVGQRPFTSGELSGLTPGVGINCLPGGMPLVAGSQRYGHGLGIRGDTSLALASDGTATTLVGEVVILEGRANVRVMADAKLAWESGARAAGDPAVCFTASVTGAKQVRVEVVPVDDALPLVIVGWPTLVN